MSEDPVIVPSPFAELIDFAMDLDRHMMKTHANGFYRPHFVGEFWPEFPDGNVVLVTQVEDGIRQRVPMFLPEELAPGMKRSEYHWYIKSPVWAVKAHLSKERAGWRCQVCNKSSDVITLDAHHRTYDRLGNELPEDITVLCRNCHSLYELDRKNGSHR